MLLIQGATFNRPIFLGAPSLTPTITISKNGGAFGAAAGSVAEISGGWYNVALAAGDTDTLGSLAYLSDAGTMPPDLADQVVVDVPGGTVSGVTGDIGGKVLGGGASAFVADGVQVADPWSTALPGSYGAGTAGYILGTPVDPWSTALPGAYGAGTAGYVLANVGDPWSTALPGAYGAGTAGYILGTPVDPWSTALPGAYGAGTAGYVLANVGDPWSTALPGAYGAGTAGYIVGGALDATVSSRTTGQPTNFAALSIDGSGRIDVGALNGDSTSAANLAKSARGLFWGSVTGSPATTGFVDTARTEADANFWVNRWVIFTSGALAGQAQQITAFDPTTHAFTTNAFTSAPSVADAYVIA